DARVGGRALDAPTAEVHAQLVGAALDRHFLEREELHFGCVQRAGRARIERLDLDAIIEVAYARRVAEVRGVLRRCDPSRAKRGDAGNELEQVEQIDGAGLEHLVARPVVLPADATSWGISACASGA